MAAFPPPEGVALGAALADVVAALTDAGVAAVIDPADLAIPGALVYPNMVDYDTFGAGPDGYELTADIVLVAGAGSPSSALDQLDAMLRAIRAMWPVGTARAVSVNLANQSPDPMPALQLSVTFSVSPTA